VKVRWIVALSLAGLMHAQSVQSGRSVMTGAFASQGQATGGSGPLTYSARTDLAVFGTGATGELLPAACDGNVACLANAYNPSATAGHQGAALSYTGSATQAPPAAGTTVSGPNINGLNSYLNGYGTVVNDPDFGTEMIRATDASMNSGVPCLGGGGFGVQFNMGSAGDAHDWASDMSKLLIQNTGSQQNLLAFNPSTGQVTPSDLCGNYLPSSATLAWTNAHVLYGINRDQENTVQFSSSTGAFLTGETVSNGSASAALQAINPSSNLAQFGVVTGTAAGNVWTGQTSGATLTAIANPPVGAANTPFAVTLYEGVLCDGSSDPVESVCGSLNPWFGTSNSCAGAGNSSSPACWYIQWELLFNFDYLPAMAGDPHFPAAQNNCLPQNYGATYNGVFQGAMDDTAFTIVFGDNGQASHTGQSGGTALTCTGAIGSGAVGNGGTHTCSGPVWVANYRQSYGCRSFNAMTDQIAGDWGPTGQALNGQANVIAGTVTGSPVPGDAWTQDVTGATTQLNCLENSSGQCATTGWTQALVGLIFGTADATHAWRDSSTGTSNYLTPSASPTNSPFYYPDVLHDLSQRANSQVAEPTLVQQGNMKVTQVAYNASTHQTTISYNNSVSYSWGQQFIFSGLAGADDTYLNCVSADQCPVWTAVAGGAQSTGITITDTAGGSTNYSDSESGSPIMTPNAQAPLNGFWELPNGGFGGLQYWQTQTLLLNVDYMATGHHASGYNYIYQGKYYTAFNQFNPSVPCVTTGVPGGPNYPGPDSPCPAADNLNLLPTSITDDQHGSNNDHGTNDYSPVAFITTQVCGQAGNGVGDAACEPEYASIWDSEIIAVENWVTRSSPGNLVGADCNYGAGPAPCVYRVGHTFNTDDNWNFNGQNGIGNCSPDGNWCAWVSDWNKTLGCEDGTTNCWSSWEATAPTANGTAVSWTSDASGNVTISMPNQFCPTGGQQYWWVSGAVQSVACGTRAGTVKLTGFSESWLNNQTLTLGANTANNWGCDSTDSNAGNCNAFVLASVPGATLSSGGTETATQKATPTECGNGVPCQRADVFIAKISSAHQ
jgi:hypothetical protein